MKIGVKSGDWVRLTPLWPGIWKVYRILSGFKENRWSLGEPLVPSKRVIVFCHRVVNDSWKRSFSHQSCELLYVSSLEPDERNRLDALLVSDTKLQASFEKYQAKQNTIDLIANIAFGGLSKRAVASFPTLCDKMLGTRIDAGITIREVLLVLQEHGLYKHMRDLPQQVTLQLTSINHELRGDETVYRKYRVLPL